MKVFVMLGLLLTVLFLIHLAWWRIRLPHHQRPVLLLLFIGGGLFLVPLLAWLGSEKNWALSWIQWMNVALGIVAFALFYTVTYSALEADSPTLSLLRFIHEQGPEGVSREDLKAFMEMRPFVAARLTALMQDNMLVEEKGRYRLARHPYLLFRLVLFYRNTILGVKGSGG
jgi:hypothetical protein